MDTATQPILSVTGVSKTYAGGFQALREVNLNVAKGEILALLGPNGAGKTTLISIICGIVRPTAGQVTVAGHDIIKDYRKTRAIIGLVPQELTTESFESVKNTLAFSRGLFGRPSAPDHIEKVLRSLALWGRRNDMIMTLSGGMKRRVLIAKALAHEPTVLFLDEPTAGVDVSLRKDMWNIVRELKAQGVTIILTTHYIEEAEEIADRVGVINKGELMLVEEKRELMTKMGRKRLLLDLVEPLQRLPAALADRGLELEEEGRRLTYTYDSQTEGDARADITSLLDDLKAQNIRFRDLHTTQSSLEDIFVDLLRETEGAPR